MSQRPVPSSSDPIYQVFTKHALLHKCWPTELLRPGSLAAPARRALRQALFELIASGYTDLTIADRLGLSYRSVKRYLRCRVRSTEAQR